jgi:hypothetical protein
LALRKIGKIFLSQISIFRRLGEGTKGFCGRKRGTMRMKRKSGSEQGLPHQLFPLYPLGSTPASLYRQMTFCKSIHLCREEWTLTEFFSLESL